ncbi:hypothetical protein OG548_08255 [Streptomyces sp. NBC_01356]|uniref:hypothetical protein n=1 Tax=Streptomyces sp. NBC_01356 TaxID=2903836 RepID=UPI002E32086C|nr:hypothetical protein [Streptomyces sp. NBC_01356]
MPEKIEEPTTDETAVTEVPPGDAPSDADPAGSEALGDAGKKALDSMKGKWREERDQRRALEARIAVLEAPKGESTDQPSADEIRTQATREATSKANARILRSEVKAAAAGKFADVSDALLNLDLKKFEVDENGDVDPSEIKDAIEELLTRKPHLAAKAGRFQGTGDGGAQRKAAGPTQLTRGDLKGMSPEAISKAKAEGRLNKVLGISN